MPDDRPLSPSMSPNRAILRKNQSVCPQEMVQEDMKILEPRSDPILRMGVTPREITERIPGITPATKIRTNPYSRFGPATADRGSRGSEINHGIHRNTRKRESESTSPFRVLRCVPWLPVCDDSSCRGNTMADPPRAGGAISPVSSRCSFSWISSISWFDRFVLRGAGGTPGL